jgi:hypothetical protein
MTVYRLPIADADASMVLLPRMPEGVRAVKLGAMATPQRLDLMPTPGRLAP